MTDYLTRLELLSYLTDTHERVVRPELFGGRAVLIRELTARARMLANEAAQAASPDAPDQALYQAMVIQWSVVDPQSGTAGADGRIDPRTRTPLLSLSDVESVADGRQAPMHALFVEILALGALTADAMFRRDTGADGAQRDASAGDDAGETDAP